MASKSIDFATISIFPRLKKYEASASTWGATLVNLNSGSALTHWDYVDPLIEGRVVLSLSPGKRFTSPAI